MSYNEAVRFDVLIVVLLKIEVFWDVTLCHLVNGFGCFEDLNLHIIAEYYKQIRESNYLYTWKNMS